MSVNIYKFGGASVKDAAGFINVANIIAQRKDQKIGVVVSATGKTTNALEEVVNAYFQHRGNAKQLIDAIKQHHLSIGADLGISGEVIEEEFNDLFVEVDWILEDEVHDSYDYLYDQIVSIGELVSSKILYHLLKSKGVKTEWIDIRDVLITDENHREAKVKWDITLPKIKERVDVALVESDVVVTQGFIGSTTENNTTTLGREGSDYTAAILSYCIDAEGMHIWKDVPGVLTADPAMFENVTKIERLSYNEAIEMTYYGAKVIHPKTIKPLQNKNIPLYVRPFGDISSMGTRIGDSGEFTYPPIVVIEPNQCLVHISVKDFSFVAEQHISEIFRIISELRLKVNMMRNTAISFSLCLQNNPEKIEQFKKSIGNEFSILVDENLELITIRHYSDEVLEQMKKGKLTLMEERLRDTVQIVVKEVPPIVRK